MLNFFRKNFKKLVQDKFSTKFVNSDYANVPLNKKLKKNVSSLRGVVFFKYFVNILNFIRPSYKFMEESHKEFILKNLYKKQLSLPNQTSDISKINFSKKSLFSVRFSDVLNYNVKKIVMKDVYHSLSLENLNPDAYEDQSIIHEPESASTLADDYHHGGDKRRRYNNKINLKTGGVIHNLMPIPLDLSRLSGLTYGRKVDRFFLFFNPKKKDQFSFKSKFDIKFLNKIKFFRRNLINNYSTNEFLSIDKLLFQKGLFDSEDDAYIEDLTNESPKRYEMDVPEVIEFSLAVVILIEVLAVTYLFSYFYGSFTDLFFFIKGNFLAVTPWNTILLTTNQGVIFSIVFSTMIGWLATTVFGWFFEVDDSMESYVGSIGDDANPDGFVHTAQGIGPPDSNTIFSIFYCCFYIAPIQFAFLFFSLLGLSIFMVSIKVFLFPSFLFPGLFLYQLRSKFMESFFFYWNYSGFKNRLKNYYDRPRRSSFFFLRRRRRKDIKRSKKKKYLKRHKKFFTRGAVVEKKRRNRYKKISNLLRMESSSLKDRYPLLYRFRENRLEKGIRLRALNKFNVKTKYLRNFKNLVKRRFQKKKFRGRRFSRFRSRYWKRNPRLLKRDFLNKYTKQLGLNFQNQNNYMLKKRDKTGFYKNLNELSLMRGNLKLKRKNVLYWRFYSNKPFFNIKYNLLDQKWKQTFPRFKTFRLKNPMRKKRFMYDKFNNIMRKKKRSFKHRRNNPILGYLKTKNHMENKYLFKYQNFKYLFYKKRKRTRRRRKLKKKMFKRFKRRSYFRRPARTVRLKMNSLTKRNYYARKLLLKKKVKPRDTYMTRFRDLVNLKKYPLLIRYYGDQIKPSDDKLLLDEPFFAHPIQSNPEDEFEEEDDDAVPGTFQRNFVSSRQPRYMFKNWAHTYDEGSILSEVPYEFFDINDSNNSTSQRYINWISDLEAKMYSSNNNYIDHGNHLEDPRYEDSEVPEYLIFPESYDDESLREPYYGIFKPLGRINNYDITDDAEIADMDIAYLNPNEFGDNIGEYYKFNTLTYNDEAGSLSERGLLFDLNKYYLDTTNLESRFKVKRALNDPLSSNSAYPKAFYLSFLDSWARSRKRGNKYLTFLGNNHMREGQFNYRYMQDLFQDTNFMNKSFFFLRNPEILNRIIMYNKFVLNSDLEGAHKLLDTDFHIKNYFGLKEAFLNNPSKMYLRGLRPRASTHSLFRKNFTRLSFFNAPLNFTRYHNLTGPYDESIFDLTGDSRSDSNSFFKVSSKKKYWNNFINNIGLNLVKNIRQNIRVPLMSNSSGFYRRVNLLKNVYNLQTKTNNLNNIILNHNKNKFISEPKKKLTFFQKFLLRKSKKNVNIKSDLNFLKKFRIISWFLVNKFATKNKRPFIKNPYFNNESPWDLYKSLYSWPLTWMDTQLYMNLYNKQLDFYHKYMFYEDALGISRYVKDYPKYNRKNSRIGRRGLNVMLPKRELPNLIGVPDAEEIALEFGDDPNVDIDKLDMESSHSFPNLMNRRFPIIDKEGDFAFQTDVLTEGKLVRRGVPRKLNRNIYFSTFFNRKDKMLYPSIKNEGSRRYSSMYKTLSKVKLKPFYSIYNKGVSKDKYFYNTNLYWNKIRHLFFMESIMLEDSFYKDNLFKNYKNAFYNKKTLHPLESSFTKVDTSSYIDSLFKNILRDNLLGADYLSAIVKKVRSRKSIYSRHMRKVSKGNHFNPIKMYKNLRFYRYFRKINLQIELLRRMLLKTDDELSEKYIFLKNKFIKLIFLRKLCLMYLLKRKQESFFFFNTNRTSFKKRRKRSFVNRKNPFRIFKKRKLKKTRLLYKDFSIWKKWRKFVSLKVKSKVFSHKKQSWLKKDGLSDIMKEGRKGYYAGYNYRFNMDPDYDAQLAILYKNIRGNHMFPYDVDRPFRRIMELPMDGYDESEFSALDHAGQVINSESPARVISRDFTRSVDKMYGFVEDLPAFVETIKERLDHEVDPSLSKYAPLHWLNEYQHFIPLTEFIDYNNVVTPLRKNNFIDLDEEDYLNEFYLKESDVDMNNTLWLNPEYRKHNLLKSIVNRDNFLSYKVKNMSDFFLNEGYTKLMGEESDFVKQYNIYKSDYRRVKYKRTPGFATAPFTYSRRDLALKKLGNFFFKKKRLKNFRPMKLTKGLNINLSFFKNIKNNTEIDTKKLFFSKIGLFIKKSVYLFFLKKLDFVQRKNFTRLDSLEHITDRYNLDDSYFFIDIQKFLYSLMLRKYINFLDLNIDSNISKKKIQMGKIKTFILYLKLRNLLKKRDKNGVISVNGKQFDSVQKFRLPFSRFIYWVTRNELKKKLMVKKMKQNRRVLFNNRFFNIMYPSMLVGHVHNRRRKFFFQKISKHEKSKLYQDLISKSFNIPFLPLSYNNRVYKKHRKLYLQKHLVNKYKRKSFRKNFLDFLEVDPFTWSKDRQMYRRRRRRSISENLIFANSIVKNFGYDENTALGASRNFFKTNNHGFLDNKDLDSKFNDIFFNNYNIYDRFTLNNLFIDSQINRNHFDRLKRFSFANTRKNFFNHYEPYLLNSDYLHCNFKLFLYMSFFKFKYPKPKIASLRTHFFFKNAAKTLKGDFHKNLDYLDYDYTKSMKYNLNQIRYKNDTDVELMNLRRRWQFMRKFLYKYTDVQYNINKVDKVIFDKNYYLFRKYRKYNYILNNIFFENNSTKENMVNGRNDFFFDWNNLNFSFLAKHRQNQLNFIRKNILNFENIGIKVNHSNFSNKNFDEKFLKINNILINSNKPQLNVEVYPRYVSKTLREKSFDLLKNNYRAGTLQRKIDDPYKIFSKTKFYNKIKKVRKSSQSRFSLGEPVVDRITKSEYGVNFYNVLKRRFKYDITILDSFTDRFTNEGFLFRSPHERRQYLSKDKFLKSYNLDNTYRFSNPRLFVVFPHLIKHFYYKKYFSDNGMTFKNNMKEDFLLPYLFYDKNQSSQILYWKQLKTIFKFNTKQSFLIWLKRKYGNNLTNSFKSNNFLWRDVNYFSESKLRSLYQEYKLHLKKHKVPRARVNRKYVFLKADAVYGKGNIKITKERLRDDFFYKRQDLLNLLKKTVFSIKALSGYLFFKYKIFNWNDRLNTHVRVGDERNFMDSELENLIIDRTNDFYLKSFWRFRIPRSNIFYKYFLDDKWDKSLDLNESSGVVMRLNEFLNAFSQDLTLDNSFFNFNTYKKGRYVQTSDNDLFFGNNQMNAFFNLDTQLRDQASLFLESKSNTIKINDSILAEQMNKIAQDELYKLIFQYENLILDRKQSRFVNTQLFLDSTVSKNVIELKYLVSLEKDINLLRPFFHNDLGSKYFNLTSTDRKLISNFNFMEHLVNSSRIGNISYPQKVWFTDRLLFWLTESNLNDVFQSFYLQELLLMFNYKYFLNLLFDNFLPSSFKEIINSFYNFLKLVKRGALSDFWTIDWIYSEDFMPYIFYILNTNLFLSFYVVFILFYMAWYINWVHTRYSGNSSMFVDGFDYEKMPRFHMYSSDLHYYDDVRTSKMKRKIDKLEMSGEGRRMHRSLFKHFIKNARYTLGLGTSMFNKEKRRFYSSKEDLKVYMRPYKRYSKELDRRRSFYDSWGLVPSVQKRVSSLFKKFKSIQARSNQNTSEEELRLSQAHGLKGPLPYHRRNLFVERTALPRRFFAYMRFKSPMKRYSSESLSGFDHPLNPYFFSINQQNKALTYDPKTLTFRYTFDVNRQLTSFLDKKSKFSNKFLSYYNTKFKKGLLLYNLYKQEGFSIKDILSIKLPLREGMRPETPGLIDDYVSLVSPRGRYLLNSYFGKTRPNRDILQLAGLQLYVGSTLNFYKLSRDLENRFFKKNFFMYKYPLSESRFILGKTAKSLFKTPYNNRDRSQKKFQTLSNTRLLFFNENLQVARRILKSDFERSFYRAGLNHFLKEKFMRSQSLAVKDKLDSLNIFFNKRRDFWMKEKIRYIRNKDIKEAVNIRKARNRFFGNELDDSKSKGQFKTFFRYFYPKKASSTDPLLYSFVYARNELFDNFAEEQLVHDSLERSYNFRFVYGYRFGDMILRGTWFYIKFLCIMFLSLIIFLFLYKIYLYLGIFFFK